MKKILAAALLAFPMFAHAEAVPLYATANNAGGINYVLGNADQCPMSKLAFVAQRPFQEPLRGCVIREDGNTFHVYFENGLELDYTYDGWVKLDQKKKTAKGTL